MRTRSSFQHARHDPAYRWALGGVLSLIVAFNSSAAYLAQQTAAANKNAPQSAKNPSHFVQAEALLRQGSLEEAKTETQQQLRLHPDSAEGYRLLGIIYVTEKDFPNAMEAFEHAVKLDPTSAGTRNDLGSVYLAQQKPALAEKEFRKALLLEPANRDANFNLGLLLLAKNQPAEAIPHFLRVRPQDVPTRMNLIRAYLRVGRTADGLKLAKDISSENRDDVDLHTALGVLMASEKQWSS